MKFVFAGLFTSLAHQTVNAAPVLLSEGTGVDASASVAVIGESDASSGFFSYDLIDMCGGKCGANEVCAVYDHCKDLKPGMLCTNVAMDECQPTSRGNILLGASPPSSVSTIGGVGFGGSVLYETDPYSQQDPVDMCGGQCAADGICEFFDHCKDLKPGMVWTAVTMFKCQKRNGISSPPVSSDSGVSSPHSVPTDSSVSSPPSSEQKPAEPIDMCGGKCVADEVCAFYDHCKDLQPGMVCPAIAMFQCQKK